MQPNLARAMEPRVPRFTRTVKPSLGKRFAFDGKATYRLNQLQLDMKCEVEEKIANGTYTFEFVPCCICEEKEFQLLASKDRYGLFMQVVICSRCGLIQTNPRMTCDSYLQFYDFEYRNLYGGVKGPTGEFFQSQYNQGERVYRFLESVLGGPAEGMRILEVGTGAGGILKYFHDRGNEVKGIDVGRQYLQWSQETHGLDLSAGTVKTLSRKTLFDIVIYSHVLEHVLDPVAEMVEVRNLLKPSGFVYIEVPGIKHLMRSYNRDFLQYLQNAHVYHFSFATLVNLMEKAGFRAIKGNEIIVSAFAPGGAGGALRNDYSDGLAYLKKIERWRLVPTSQVLVSSASTLAKMVGIHGWLKKLSGTLLRSRPHTH